ncbi:MAG: tandem-95 repeat protein [Cryobacterium sp.]|nr:tandem-95 repeat protein [Cryobacterium sp.]
MFRKWLAGHKSLAASMTSGTVIVAVVISTAVISGGYPAQKVELNDASVWVSNGSQQFIGRANTQVLELNTVVPADSSELDIVQAGTTVLLFDEGSSKVGIVDPATSTIVDSVPMPTTAPRLFIAGENVVVADGDGAVWIVPAAEFQHFDPAVTPTLSLGSSAVYAMNENGDLIAYSRDAHLVYRIDAAVTATVVETHEVSLGSAASVQSVTWVGSDWAVLDSTSRTLVVDGNTVDLSNLISAADSIRLQEPSTEGSGILVAYSGGLLLVAGTGGTPRSLVSDRSGNAAPPLEADGCSFAAWSDGTAWRKCGTADAVTLNLAGMPQGAVRLGFNRNGNRVVLNDPRGGGSWAVQSDGELINNWEGLVHVQQQQEQVKEDNLDTPPEYDKVQQPPVAVDDSFGARPGRSAILPVLLNDYDPNGDVLVISQSTQLDESVGRLDLVNNRQQVQITLTPAARGSVTFHYTITDGRGGEASATVTVAVREPNENSPPVQMRKSRNVVAQGGRVSTSVLGDWVDPDGDAFYLASASTTAPDVVSFKPDGTVVFVEGGAASVSRSVSLVVTDGSAEASGSLSITVSAPGKVPILADPFVVLAYAGQDVTVHPLMHVRGGTGTVRLSSVPARTGADITASPDSGTFRFTSSQVRTFSLEYVVTDGDQTATGTLRIDVAAPPDANTRPITVPKTVFVKSLSSETVDIANSDFDPAGGVLLVTSVSGISPGSGIQAEILDQRSIRVTLTAPQENGPVTFDYRVTNGLADADGSVTVIEIPRPVKLQPPIATDDTISVRVGAAIDIPVLDNDVQPDGEALTLDPQLTSTLRGDSGLLFASGNVLRYLAPDKPGNFSATYSVSGPDGQTSQAQVRIAVREIVPATNNAPEPVTVVARVLSGERVNIQIPLTGIDPDGDSVQLLGQETNPEKGSVTPNGSDGFTYEAGDYSAGTDSFTYTVIDALGARATGTVRIGISPRTGGARNPVAVADEVAIRPGGSVTIQVLANDSDPDGSPLTVTEVHPVSDESVVATTDGTLVTVTPPPIAGQYGLIYTIQNELGGTSQNFVTVTVSPDAPRALPIARDTVLTLTDILGRDSIDVNVLANVFFADGPVSQLGVALLPGYDSGVSVTSKKRIKVTVGQKRQIIPFSVSNPDDPTVVAYAFVWVPGYDDALPQVNRKARPLTIPSESVLTIPLNDYVIAIGGKQVRLADTTTVRATHADGASLVRDDQTLVFRSAEKYFGPASISFDVTDGTSATDPNGRTATLVLPITVTPRENQPPVFNGAVIDFEPAQEKTIDLLKLTNYPYPNDLDELTYTALAPLPVGFSYTLTGQTLSIKAKPDAVKGTSTALVLGVRDALVEGKAGSIQLNVVASSRPLAKPASDSAITPRGKTTTIDVLANDEATNPFPGNPLSVVGIRGIDGASLPPGVTITPSKNLRTLTVAVSKEAPAQDVNVQYEVADATGDPDRYVWGNVQLQIQDAPDPVTGVRVAAFGDQTVTIAWSPGSFNNSPITGYEVTATRTDNGAVFGVTSCAVTNGCLVKTPGNGPGNALRISVVAINAIGPSDPAIIGSAVWSDVLPSAPTGLTAVPTNAAPAGGSLAIGWASVADPAHGSPVTGYTVRITGPSVDISRLVPVGTTTLAFANSASSLVPGVAYSVNVYARNSAQVAAESSWLRNSPVLVTAVGPPGQASGGVTGVVFNTQGHIRVSWGPSSPQGAPGVTYTVGRFESTDTLPTTCQAPNPGSGTPGFTDTTWDDTNVQDQHTYRYVVYADNGYYCTPTASGEVLTMRAPGKAFGRIWLQPQGGQYDIQVRTGLSVSSLTAAKFQYDVNGNNNWQDVEEGQFLTSAEDASVYGNATTIRFRGCRDLTDTFCGDPSNGVTRTPLNTRGTIVSCVIGANVVPGPPVNAGSFPVTYSYSFDSGLGFGGYGPDSTVPTPIIPLIGHTSVRMKAVVDFGVGVSPEHTNRYFTDPGYAEATCTEAPE